MPSLADHISALGSSTAWRRTGAVPVRGEAGHPQGLAKMGDRWVVTTVHLAPRGRAEAFMVDADGTVAVRQDLTDGDRIHPGGLTAAAGGFIVAVAEYRPSSSTRIVRLDTGLQPTNTAVVDDHLGAVCELPDRSLLAVSWGSRRLYRLDPDGAVIQAADNPVHFVDFQDLTVASPTTVVATGVGTVPRPGSPVDLGGVGLIDVDALAVRHAAPVHAWLDSGRSITFNGVHVDVSEGRLRLSCIADDGAASIETWVVDG